MTELPLRPPVAVFAQDIEKRLRANDYKGGWQGEGIHLLLAGAIREIAEVLDTLDGKQANPTFYTTGRMLAHAAAELSGFGPYLKVGLKEAHLRREHPVAEAADAAAYLMMVADRTRDLPSDIEGEHDRCSWAGCAAGKPLACPKRAGNSGGPFADLTENQRRQIREAQASAKKGEPHGKPIGKPLGNQGGGKQ